MFAPETLRGIIAKAADPRDGDDVATRRLLANELGAVITMCPHADKGAATPAADGGGAPDTCALGGQLTPACDGCLLSS